MNKNNILPSRITANWKLSMMNNLEITEGCESYNFKSWLWLSIWIILLFSFTPVIKTMRESTCSPLWIEIFNLGNFFDFLFNNTFLFC